LPNHYTVIVHATNSSAARPSAAARRSSTADGEQPTRSTNIAFEKANSGVWGDTNARVFVVNPDRSSVRGFTANTTTGVLTAVWEKDVGRNPRTLGVRPGTKEVWIVSQDDPSIKVLNGVDGAYIGVVVLPPASRPYGIAFNPAGTFAFVTLQGTGKLIKITGAFAKNSYGYAPPTRPWARWTWARSRAAWRWPATAPRPT
jgi:DNA-binding beta-propeller fold protein YncE